MQYEVMVRANEQMPWRILRLTSDRLLAEALATSARKATYEARVDPVVRLREPREGWWDNLGEKRDV